MNGDTPNTPDQPEVDVRKQTLVEVYWKLREHADNYRNTAMFKKTYANWQAERDDKRAYQRHVIHEFYVRGIELGARDVAAMLGVPENEIERPEKREGSVE